MISIAVAGGRVEPPRAVPTVIRVLQLMLSADRDRAGSLRRPEGGSRPPRARAGEHAAWPPAIAHAAATASAAAAGCARLRTPVGFVLTGSRGPRGRRACCRRPSIAPRTPPGSSSRCVSTNVFESGKVVVDLRGPGRRGLLHAARRGALAAASAGASVDAVKSLDDAPGRRAGPARRAARPRSVGPLHYSLEPNATGWSPVAHDRGDLWTKRRVPRGALRRRHLRRADARRAGRGYFGKRMADYVSADDRQALPSPSWPRSTAARGRASRPEPR